MPETAQYTSLVTVGTDTFSDVVSVAGNSKEVASPTVPAAKVGQLTTRTDNDTGVATMVAGHGFITGDLIDLFWSGGSRRNMTATVAVNAVTLDGGSGDNLPANLTAVTAMKPTEVDFVVNGANVVALGVKSNAIGWVVFVDNAAAIIAAAAFRITVAGGYGKPWASGNGITNPLGASVTSKVKFSHGEITAVDMKAVAVF
jgi:hypothetical protein